MGASFSRKKLVGSPLHCIVHLGIKKYLKNIKIENIKGRKQPFSRKKVDLFSIALVTWSEKISKEYQNRKYHREKAGEYQNCPS